MRHATILALLLVTSSCFAQTQSAEPALFLTALQNMPAQIRAGTFDQQAFNASLAQAQADANFDMPAVCRPLDADLADSNLLVSQQAVMVLSDLLRRKNNTQADRQTIGATLLSCVDKGRDQGSQLVCVSLVTDYGIPMSILAQFKDIAARKIADGTAYPALAIGLSLVAARWPDVHADVVLADFFRGQNVLDTVKTRAIFSLQNMLLSDAVLDAVAELLSKTKSDELKVQIIEVSQKWGGHALEREHNTLLGLEADLSESHQVRQAAGSALRSTSQGSATVPGIH